jgi:hypothetical protein
VYLSSSSCISSYCCNELALLGSCIYLTWESHLLSGYPAELKVITFIGSLEHFNGVYSCVYIFSAAALNAAQIEKVYQFFSVFNIRSGKIVCGAKKV